MRLFYSATSPYARKVRIVIAEKGLEHRVESILCNPFDVVPELLAVNPLGKVPSLLLDDGTAHFDSPVISEYLDSLDGTVQLLPASGPDRWRALHQQALGDGILDAAFSVAMESRRPEEKQSPDWIGRWTAAITRSFHALEVEMDGMGENVTLGHIAFGAALGYLDLRLPVLDWRAECPKTASWFMTFSERPSMRVTRPDM